MSWWDRWVWSRVANREALTLEQLLAEEAQGQRTAAGEPVTVDTALRLSTVWGCVRLLADSVSTLPLHVYRGDDRDPSPRRRCCNAHPRTSPSSPTGSTKAIQRAPPALGSLRRSKGGAET